MKQDTHYLPKVKFCGLVREVDVRTAVDCGVDAIGFVFYEKSPRFVSIEQAQVLRQSIPPEVAAVGLFVNATRANVASTVQAVGLDVVQFHGDETASDLDGWPIPVWRAVRMRAATDVQEARLQFPMAQYFVLDAHVDTYGGAGQTFDWNMLTSAEGVGTGARSDLILSAGLNAENVGSGIRKVRPAWVDVSSGIQGADARHKDPERMRRFIQAVRNWDTGIA